jgi:hypothetical protein
MSTSEDASGEAAAVWKQFLIARSNLLAQYDAAMAHALSQPVPTHHGNVGEAAVRDWLTTFLPKRFGVTSGHIRKQGFADSHVTSHFDVIVYDQIEAPVLWIESNPDKSPGGLSRIIPAENVRAVIEVKASLSNESAKAAVAKLSELAPVMNGADAPNERYPRFLPITSVLVVLFIELRKANSHDKHVLDIFRDAAFQRAFYGAVVLRGEGRGEQTAYIVKTVWDEPMEPFSMDQGLLGNFVSPASAPAEGKHVGSMIQWSALRFADFAFDLLALLKGTFERGRASSLHGLDFSHFDSTVNTDPNQP